MKQGNPATGRTTLRQKLLLAIGAMCVFIIVLEGALRGAGFLLVSMQEKRNMALMKQRNTCRILCLGESTTFNAWPAPLQDFLNKQNTGMTFSVIDKGLSGIHLTFLLSHLGDYIATYKPDVILAMVGINDILYDGWMDTETPERKDVLPAFVRSLRTYKLFNLLSLHVKDTIRTIAYRRRGTTPANETNMRVNPLVTDNADSWYRSDDPVYGEDNEYMQSAHRYRESGDYARVEEYLKKALAINPLNYGANLELAANYLALDKKDDALHYYNKAIEANPAVDAAYWMLGLFYQHESEYQKSIEMFLRALQINPKCTIAYYSLGNIYNDQGNHRSAEEMFKKMIEISSRHDWLSYGALAYLYDEMGQHGAAQDYLQKFRSISLRDYNPALQERYRQIRDVVKKSRKGLTLVFVQYPLLPIEPLKEIFPDEDAPLFVDNERIFRESLRTKGYRFYFSDRFAGLFGHCTAQGNELLAENIGRTILREIFHMGNTS